MTAPAGPRPQSLDEALVMLQADPPVLVKDKKGQVGNQKTKYADLVQVNAVVLSRLNALGVIYVCAPTLLEDGKFVLDYRLTHVGSGEHKAGRYPLKLSENPMQMGSAITYARRYVLLALTGVAAEDEDDDGQAASGQRTAQRAAAQRAAQPAREAPPADGARTAQRQARPAAARPPLPGEVNGEVESITAPQRAKLMAVLGQLQITDRDARLNLSSNLAGRKLSSANDLTKAEARALIDKLEAATRQEDPAAYLGELIAAVGEGGEPS